MSLLDQLMNEMKTAMKAGYKQRLDALRLLISALKYAQVDEPGLDDQGMLKVLSKEAKKRRESIEAYQAAGRQAQAEAEAFELSLIEEYLPKQMSEEEVRAKVKEALLQIEAGTNFGQVMQQVMKALGGQAEGGVVAKIVKEEYKPNQQ